MDRLVPSFLDLLHRHLHWSSHRCRILPQRLPDRNIPLRLRHHDGVSRYDVLPDLPCSRCLCRPGKWLSLLPYAQSCQHVLQQEAKSCSGNFCLWFCNWRPRFPCYGAEPSSESRFRMDDEGIGIPCYGLSDCLQYSCKTTCSTKTQWSHHRMECLQGTKLYSLRCWYVLQLLGRLLCIFLYWKFRKDCRWPTI